MIDQQEINKEIGQWMKQQEEANKFVEDWMERTINLTNVVNQWVEETAKQQQEIDELKLMVKVICKSLHAMNDTSYQLDKTFDEEVPEDWQVRMTWLRENHL